MVFVAQQVVFWFVRVRTLAVAIGVILAAILATALAFKRIKAKRERGGR